MIDKRTESHKKEKLIDAINSFSSYVSNETLAEKLVAGENSNGGIQQDWKIGEFDCSIGIEKISF